MTDRTIAGRFPGALVAPEDRSRARSADAPAEPAQRMRRCRSSRPPDALPRPTPRPRLRRSPSSISQACRRSIRSRRSPTSAPSSRPACRRNLPVRRFAARGRPIRRSATSSGSPRTPGTSPIRPRCRVRRAAARAPTSRSWWRRFSAMAKSRPIPTLPQCNRRRAEVRYRAGKLRRRLSGRPRLRQPARTPDQLAETREPSSRSRKPMLCSAIIILRRTIVVPMMRQKSPSNSPPAWRCIASVESRTHSLRLLTRCLVGQYLYIEIISNQGASECGIPASKKQFAPSAASANSRARSVFRSLRFPTGTGFRPSACSLSRQRPASTARSCGPISTASRCNDQRPSTTSTARARRNTRCSPRCWRARRMQSCWTSLASLRGDATPLGVAHAALARPRATTTVERVEREYLQPVHRARPRRTAALRLVLSHRLPARAPAGAAARRSRPARHRARRRQLRAGRSCRDPVRDHGRASSSGRLPAPQGTDQQIFEKHLAPWIGRFFADLERAEAANFYRRSARSAGCSWKSKRKRSRCRHETARERNARRNAMKEQDKQNKARSAVVTSFARSAPAPVSRRPPRRRSPTWPRPTARTTMRSARPATRKPIT